MTRAVRRSLAPLALGWLASCASAPAPAAHANASPSDALGLPAVRAPLEFPPGTNEVTLGWLVDELARLSGQDLAVQTELRAQLDREREPLELTTPVPADEVYAYVEGMLVQRSIFLAPVKGGARPVLGVYGMQGFAGVANPVVVSADDIEELAGHPALLCQVLLVFHNIDSRQLQTQLRQLLVDASGFQQIVPAGDRGLLMQGNGSKLLGLARTLIAVDRASAAAQRAAAAQPAAQLSKERPAPR